MKMTAIGCDSCGKTRSFRNWAKLWHDARAAGWVRGNGNDEHFCSEACREKAELTRNADHDRTRLPQEREVTP